MIEKLFRGYIQGLGSKTLGAVIAGVLAVFLAPLAYKYLGIDAGTTLDVLIMVGGLVALFVFKQWHLDAKTGGVTSTQYLMTLKALQGIEVVLPDGTKLDGAVKLLIESLQKAQGKEPPAPVPSPAPPQ